jgi:molybdopterin-guanine dinucleotide biosynthesis protein A
MTLATVLLAGGESRRMGCDKATLILDGIPLWQRQLGLLRELSPCALLVSARQPPVWLPPDARFVADSAPARGPLGGLAAALAAMPATHLLALAIDLPAMTTAHLATLWRAASPGCGVLPWLGGRAEPLPAVYPAEAAPIACGLLAGEDVSLRALARALLAAGRMKKHHIGSPEANLYANCNSPADWQRHASPSEPTHD